jgi:hypothetical protein
MERKIMVGESSQCSTTVSYLVLGDLMGIRKPAVEELGRRRVGKSTGYKIVGIGDGISTREKTATIWQVEGWIWPGCEQ